MLVRARTAARDDADRIAMSRIRTTSPSSANWSATAMMVGARITGPVMLAGFGVVLVARVRFETARWLEAVGPCNSPAKGEA